MICVHAVFFAYRRWMDATSSRNAEPPRIIPDDGGFKEFRVVPFDRGTWRQDSCPKYGMAA
jgi:hypothetical protein